MLEKFYPDRYLDSAYQIPFEELYKKGYRGIIFDVDNTLVPHGAPADGHSVKLAKKVNSPYIYKGKKPSVRGYERAMKVMGTSRETTFFVGDQLFTDVWGANRVGLHSILVKPINPKEEIQIVLKRYLEAVVLWFYINGKKRKHSGRG